MPKLASIQHERCSDYGGKTYVWVPDEWTEDDLDEAVGKAMDEYLLYLGKWKEEQTPPNTASAYSKPPYEQYPDLKVSEVQKIHEEQKAVYAEWEKLKSKAEKSFAFFLRDQGCQLFYEVDAELEATAYWGHRHGMRIEYDTTEITDLKGPAKTEDGDW